MKKYRYEFKGETLRNYRQTIIDTAWDTEDESHICPICGTPAPHIYDGEEHPAWDCAVCIESDEEEEGK